MVFRFITISLKHPFSRKENLNADLKSIPLSIRKDLEARRALCVFKFEALKKAFEKGDKYKDNLWYTTEGREKLINDIVDVVSLYESEVAAALFKYPVFATGYYYRWDSSLVEGTDVLFDDFRYDLQNMYYNIAVVFMNMAEYLLCWQMTPSNASRLEKESYRFLLQAAGYFFLVSQMAEDVKHFFVGDTTLTRPEDVQTDFLEFCRLIALAQAQEIGTTKAVENEVGGGKAMVARLSHYILRCYQEALDVAEKSIKSTSNDYMGLVSFVKFKIDVFRALTFSYAGSSLFDSNPSEGLWFVSQSDLYVKCVVNYRDQARIKRKKMLFRGDDLIQECRDIVQKNYERCTRINSLVHRVKAAEGPLTLPSPYVLAHMKEVRLPVSFPHQVAHRTSLPSTENL